MGIPSYFSYIVKNHPQIIIKYSRFLQNNTVNNLYLDSNSIIYDSYRIMLETNDLLNKTKFEKRLIENVYNLIENYIQIIKPTDTIYIAFDGVAPVAKMEQQRSRRFKSSFEKKILKHIKPSNNNTLWDKTCITPGTDFMEKLNKYIVKFFKNKEKKYNVNKIIVSGPNEPGEGEHKLFDYIKNNKFFHYSRNTVVYGLDADLIMLAINHLHISKHIYLFRETPEFIKSIDKNLDPNESYILDIPLLSNHIRNDLVITDYKKKYILQDYIFICFLLGNDFLPHFPSLNIRTQGFENIYNTYIQLFGSNNKTIIVNNEICWKHFKMFINALANHEHDYIKKEYKIRDRKEKRTISCHTDENIYRKYLHTPIYNRINELYINPFERYWENRYYKTLLNIEPTEENIKKICINYLEGLEWTFKYYTIGCQDWRWKYKYHYPPLLIDLCKYIPNFNTCMIDKTINTPVSHYVQLAYVLPKDSLHFLPKKIYNHMLNKFDDYYNCQVNLKWDFCTYIWESHPELPELSIDKIEQSINHLIK